MNTFDPRHGTIDHLAGENISTKKGDDSVLSLDNAVKRKYDKFSFFVDSDDNSMAPHSSYSSASSSTLNSSASTESNISSSDSDGAKSDDCLENSRAIKIKDNRRASLTGFSTKDSDYAIERSMVPVEAANQALRRLAARGFGSDQQTDLHSDESPYVITSVGRGSSRADVIHEKDQRPLWKQGYDNENESDGDNAARIAAVPSSKKIDFLLPTESIAEQAAKVGRLRHEQQSKKIDNPSNHNTYTFPESKIQTERIYVEDAARCSVDHDEDPPFASSARAKMVSFDKFENSHNGNNNVPLHVTARVVASPRRRRRNTWSPVTPRVLLNFALTLARISSKLKRYPRK